MMRKRITRALAAAAAAGVTLATFGLGTVGASASVIGHRPHAKHAKHAKHVNRVKQMKPKPALGAPIYTKNMAGYQASGRLFRFISAVITVPDWKPTGLEPHEYIQLAAPDQWVRVGITYFKKKHYGMSGGQWGYFSGWATFVAARNNALFPRHRPQVYFPRQPLQPGDGVSFSIYYDRGTDTLHFAIVPPPVNGVPQPDYFDARAHGPLFNQADLLDDWTYTCPNPLFCQPVALPPFFHPFVINKFLKIRITTFNGQRGTLIGPWLTSPVLASSNGLAFPLGAVRAEPTRPFTDGLDGPFDAFAVKAR